jgi:hypothetical protein
MTIATSFKPRPTTCPRSTSTASDPSHPRSRSAAGPGETLRKRQKNAAPGGKGARFRNAFSAPGRPGPRLTSRSSVRKRSRKCHWPGYPFGT